MKARPIAAPKKRVGEKIPPAPPKHRRQVAAAELRNRQENRLWATNAAVEHIFQISVAEAERADFANGKENRDTNQASSLLRQPLVSERTG